MAMAPLSALTPPNGGAPQTFTGTGGTATWTWNPTTGQYDYTMAAPGGQAGQAPVAGAPMEAVTGWQINLTMAQIDKWAYDAANDRRAIDNKYVADQQQFGLDVANANFQRSMAVYQAKNQRLQYETDKAKLGVQVAESNRQSRAQELTFKMQALAMLADRKGPQDWIAYNHLVNGLAAPTPEASQQINVFDTIAAANLGEQIAVNMPAGPTDADIAALGTAYAPPAAPSPAAMPQPAPIPVQAPAVQANPFGAPPASGQTPTGPVLGFNQDGTPIFGPNAAAGAPALTVPAAPSPFGGPVAAPAAGVSPAPAAAPIPVTPSGYAPTPFNPTPAAAPVSPSGYSITPFNPAMSPINQNQYNPFGSTADPIPVTQMNPVNQNQYNPFGSSADASAFPGYEHGTGGYINAAPRVVGEEGPELEHNVIDPRTGQMMIRVVPLTEAQERMATGMPGVRGMATGGTMTVNTYSPETMGQQPFLQKLRGEQEAPLFTGYGSSIDAPSVGVYGLPAVPSQQRLNRLLPSEQLMLQGTYEEAGQYWADILEKARRASVGGATMPALRYGG